MNFSLAGLLRVRGAQERMAAEAQSLAQTQMEQANAARQHAVSSLAEISTVVDEGSTLLALAAARAAGRASLEDLQAVVALRRGEAAEAQAAHIEAKRELKGLQRLESAHQITAVRATLSAEQAMLDEVAVVRSARADAASTSQPSESTKGLFG